MVGGWEVSPHSGLGREIEAQEDGMWRLLSGVGAPAATREPETLTVHSALSAEPAEVLLWRPFEQPPRSALDPEDPSTPPLLSLAR